MDCVRICHRVVLQWKFDTNLFTFHIFTGKITRLALNEFAFSSNNCFSFCLISQDTKHFETENLKAQLNNTNLRFSQDGRKLLGVLPNGTYRWVVKGNKTKTEGHKLSLTCQARACAISHNLEFIADLIGESDLKVQ